jgi:hypothetical protein
MALVGCQRRDDGAVGVFEPSHDSRLRERKSSIRGDRPNFSNPMPDRASSGPKANTHRVHDSTQRYPTSIDRPAKRRAEEGICKRKSRRTSFGSALMIRSGHPSDPFFFRTHILGRRLCPLNGSVEGRERGRGDTSFYSKSSREGGGRGGR